MNEPLFSIVMPSYLGNYQYAAKDRVRKFHRAIISIFKQTFGSYEIVVVSDGCDQTMEIMTTHYPRVPCIFIAKQAYLSGEPRNAGIKNATGKFIAYLDTDDALGDRHLEVISSQIQDDEWYFFNDWTSQDGKNFYNRWCTPQLKGQCGTSNIIHKRIGAPSWGPGYEHDWDYIQMLNRKAKPKYLLISPLYYVCHIPKVLDI